MEQRILNYPAHIYDLLLPQCPFFMEISGFNSQRRFFFLLQTITQPPLKQFFTAFCAALLVLPKNKNTQNEETDCAMFMNGRGCVRPETA